VYVCTYIYTYEMNGMLLLYVYVVVVVVVAVVVIVVVVCKDVIYTSLPLCYPHHETRPRPHTP